MNIQFENPELLHLLWVIALQALLLWLYWRWRTRHLKQLGSPQLEERLLLGFSKNRFWAKNLMFSLITILIVLAIANPRQPVKETPPPKASADVLIALDVSRSMLANDVAPSRLEQAKNFTRDLLKSLRNERVGLMVFAGDAFPQAPLSNDPDVLLLFVKNAAPDAVNNQGTNFEAALELAQRMLPATNAETGRAVVFISDGENHTPEAEAAARKANAAGLIIHTVGVGTTNGSSIPISRGNLLRDFSGQVVRTKFDDQLLRSIASAGAGIYTKIGEKDALSEIREAIGQLRRKAVEQQSVIVYRSYFQWLILPAIILLMLEQLIWWRKRS